MALKMLSVDTLGELDNGQAGGIIDAAIRAAMIDLEDRGSEDEKVRKVVITLELQKVDDDSIVATVHAAAKVPPYKTGRTVANLSYEGSKPVNGRAVPAAKFNPGSPKRPDQKTFDDVDSK